MPDMSGADLAIQFRKSIPVDKTIKEEGDTASGGMYANLANRGGGHNLPSGFLYPQFIGVTCYDLLRVVDKRKAPTR